MRDGLEVLLEAWGAEVVAFETVDDARAWAAAAGDDHRPHLLIVVTGSTIGGHEDEAAAHDFHLLIKPVLPNKLRAMIGFKLGMR